MHEQPVYSRGLSRLRFVLVSDTHRGQAGNLSIVKIATNLSDGFHLPRSIFKQEIAVDPASLNTNMAYMLRATKVAGFVTVKIAIIHSDG